MQARIEDQKCRNGGVFNYVNPLRQRPALSFRVAFVRVADTAPLWPSVARVKMNQAAFSTSIVAVFRFSHRLPA